VTTCLPAKGKRGFVATNQDHQLSMRGMVAPEVEQSLRAILVAVDYGILFTDLEHRSLICNARFGELFGISPDAVVQNEAAAVRAMVQLRISDLEGWQRNLDEVYAEPELEQEDELVLVNPNCVLRRYTGPVRDENGLVTGRLWTFLDVTSQVKKRQQREVLSKIASYFHDDPRQVCQVISDEISTHYQGIALISLLDGDFLTFHTAGGVPPEFPPIPGNRLQESFCQFCLQSREPLIVQDAKLDESYAELLPVKLGLTRYAGVPIYRAGGAVAGTLCVLDQHSEQKLGNDDLQFLSVLAMRISAELDRQEQLNNLQDDLLHTNQELEATQRQLIQSEKLALAGTLSASIAHDIRNILASMNLQIDMGSDDPERALGYVRDSLNRFNVLAHRLMSYARPKEAMFEYLNLSDVLNKVVALVTPQFNVSRMKLETIGLDREAFIRGDEGRLEHLFVNLLINALQSMSPEGTVTLRCEPEASGVTVTVQDSGSGISAAHLAKLFEPFSSTKQDGFGLGLFSCRQIANEHAAHLQCNSTVGVGTTFTIRFKNT
jgi:signal transduction histidine kinase